MKIALRWGYPALFVLLALFWIFSSLNDDETAIKAAVGVPFYLCLATIGLLVGTVITAGMTGGSDFSDALIIFGACGLAIWIGYGVLDVGQLGFSIAVALGSLSVGGLVLCYFGMSSLLGLDSDHPKIAMASAGILAASYAIGLSALNFA